MSVGMCARFLVFPLSYLRRLILCCVWTVTCAMCGVACAFRVAHEFSRDGIPKPIKCYRAVRARLRTRVCMHASRLQCGTSAAMRQHRSMPPKGSRASSACPLLVVPLGLGLSMLADFLTAPRAR